MYFSSEFLVREGLVLSVEAFNLSSLFKRE